MKKIYITLSLLVLAAISFSQPYYVYTARNSGNWDNAGNWDIQPRTDGVSKNKVVIPVSYDIIVDDDVSSMGLGDIEVNVSGTLSMANNTTLSLSNNSSIQLNNGSISGSAGNQRIYIGATLKYRGNLDGLKTGLSIADNTTGISPNGFRSLSLLPVNFTGFFLTKTDRNIELTWSTDKEVNNSHFEVERSFNGLHWEKIAVVLSLGSADEYSYTDHAISNHVVYYRLRQVDIDGKSIYSSIRSIRQDEAIPAAKIYGSQKNVIIDLNFPINNNVMVSVLNSNGQVIARRSYNNPSYKISLNLPAITPGTYIVQISDNKGWSQVKKVIL